MFLSQQHRDGVLTVSVTGRWLIENAAAITEELAALEPDRADKVRIDTQGLEDLDLTGAWCLHNWAARAQQSSRKLNGMGRSQTRCATSSVRSAILPGRPLRTRNLIW